VYINNILVYTSRPLEEYIDYIKKVLRKLKKYKLYLQLEKCKFYIKEIEYLGFIISTERVKINLKKTAAIQE
jgi:hypothetical protein